MAKLVLLPTTLISPTIVDIFASIVIVANFIFIQTHVSTLVNVSALAKKVIGKVGCVANHDDTWSIS